MSEQASSRLTVDSRGRRCPLPIIDLAAAARTAAAGSLIAELADDPAAATDIPAWCRMRGQHYLGSEPAPSTSDRVAAAYLVRLRD
jgi:tRNA 2-thiouridine synthesizing protein A